MALTIQQAKTKHEASILKMEGVVSVGIGIRKDKTKAIIIGLIRENKEIIRKIPAELEGFPVEVQIIGSLSAL
ncbi:MAG TPA: hypothetical protein VJ963_00280 [Bacteroidales bacterium]|nr:hypothetical protein [Bacteroidales bacterium]